MTAPELRPKRDGCGDVSVNRIDPGCNFGTDRIIKAVACAPFAPCGAELRFEIDECEATAQREVDDGQRSIRDIHRADYIEVLWHMDPLAGLAVGGGHPSCPRRD